MEPFSRNGTSSACGGPSRVAVAGSRTSGSPLRNAPQAGIRSIRCGRPRIVRSASPTRSSATWSARGIRSSPRASGMRMTAPSTSSSSTTVRATASSVCLEREALREGAGDLVERAELPRRLPLGGERLLELGPQLRRLLVQARVLHGDGELRRDRGDERLLVLVREAVARRVDGEQAGDLVGQRERDGERRLDPGLVDARAVRGEVARPGRVRDREQAAAAVRPERELEQALRDRQMRPGQPARAGRREPAVLAQVDRDPLGAEELDDAVERGLERVRERELRLGARNER